jgi:hypothetical protein
LAILTKQFSLGPAFLLIPFAGRWLPTEQRQAVGLLNTLAVSFLVVISLAATKLEWYPLPCVPLFSMIAAFTLERCLVATGKPISRIGLAICVGVLVFSFGRCLVLMARNVLSSDPIGRQPITQQNYTNNYQDMFSYLERHSIHSIAVFQTSVYAPIARWHQLLRSGKGLRTVIGSSVPMRELPSGTFLVTCDPALFEILKREGTEVSSSHRWVIVRKRNTRK